MKQCVQRSCRKLSQNDHASNVTFDSSTESRTDARTRRRAEKRKRDLYNLTFNLQTIDLLRIWFHLLSIYFTNIFDRSNHRFLCKHWPPRLFKKAGLTLIYLLQRPPTAARNDAPEDPRSGPEFPAEDQNSQWLRPEVSAASQSSQ